MDEDFLEELTTLENPTLAQFNDAFVRIYGAGAYPDDRIKELQVLIEKHYEVTKDTTGLYTLKP